MNAQDFWIAAESLGMVRLIMRNAAGLLEIDTVLSDHRISEQFVSFPGRPIDLHFTRDLTVDLEFRDGPNAHTGRVEHGITLRDQAGAELLRVFLVRPQGSDDHDPACVAAYRHLREQAEQTVSA
ncbi:MAG: hypothetical protein U0556_08070 [Dehalococcoidia bacterium]